MGKRLLVAALLSALGGSGCRKPLEWDFVVSTDAPSRAGFVLVDRGLVAANEDGRVLLLSEKGAPLWQTQLPRTIAFRPAVASSTVVVSTEEGEWVGLSLEEGRQVWRRSGMPPAAAALTSDGKRVFAVLTDGTAASLDARTGVLLWKTQPAAAHLSKPRLPAPLLQENLLVASLEASPLLASNADDGREVWQANILPLGLSAAGGRLYAVTATELVSLEIGTGRVVWRTPLAGSPTGGPSYALGAIWVGSSPHRLTAFDPLDGKKTRAIELPEPSVAPVLAEKGLLLVPTAGPQGHVLGFAVDLDLRRVVDIRLDNPVRLPAFAREGRLFVMTADGRLWGGTLQRPKSGGALALSSAVP